MTKAATMLAAILLIAPAVQSQSVPEMLTNVSEVKRSERISVLRQFEYQVPALQKLCPDLNAPMIVGDKLVSVRKLFREYGLDRHEPLPELTNNLLRLTKSVDDLYRQKGIKSIPGGCHDVWPAYAALRMTGLSPEETIGGIRNLLVALSPGEAIRGIQQNVRSGLRMPR